MRNSIRVGATAAIAAMALMAGAASANAETIRVDANGVAGWAFNEDTRFITPYDFSTAAASSGAGSLHVAPITNTLGSPGSRDKFIGKLPLGFSVDELSALSFDFQIDASAPANSHKHFYMNVHVNLPGSSTFYDCRFDYVAPSGSQTDFTTLSVTPSLVANSVGDRPDDDFDCPNTIGEMDDASIVREIRANVGDTSANDTGVGGYLDNVVVDVAGDTTTYDFEATPADKGACKKGSWADYGFANQGLCIARSLELTRP